MNERTLAGATGTRNAMARLSAVLGLAVLLSACDGGPSTPTSPNPTAPTATVTYSLSGAVSEMRATGSAPIEGARVIEMNSGRAVVTDVNGLYSIPGLPATSRSVSVTKDGYVTGTKTVTMSGDTQLDIRLERIVTYTLSGVVFEITEAGPVPIEDVEVYCDSCGSPDGHTFVYTDAKGFYSLAWAMNGVHPLYVRKAGYAIFDPALRDEYGRITATVRGDTRFDIQLARR